MKARAARRVFINCPFDESYEELFLTMIAGIVGVGCEPHCVLEAPSDKSRLERLEALIGSCAASIHELSSVALSGTADNPVPRFNMPFELGMAYGRRAFGGPHECFIFEAKPYRIDMSLSDIKGIDPYIHGGTPDGMLKAVLNALGPAAGQRVTLGDLKKVADGVRATVADAKATEGWSSAFDRTVFGLAVASATMLATQLRLTPA